MRSKLSQFSQRIVGYLADLGGQKSIFEKSTEVEHKITWQRRTMPEQKATLTEPLRATPPPYGLVGIGPSR
jgi:hypothetical protein